MNIDFEDKTVQLILVIAVIFISTLFWDKQEELSCLNKYRYCTLKTTNIYNLSLSRNLFIANNISGTSVTKHTIRTGSKYHRRTETRYRLNFISKTGETKKVFERYYQYSNAVNAGNKIMECLKSENYPCKFSRY